MLIPVIAAVVVGEAFLLPGSWISVFLGWLAAVLIAVMCRRPQKLYRRLFLFGLVLHSIGFYWLPDTLSYFGGFPAPAAYLLFALYAAISSLQFLLFGWLLLRLRKTPLEPLHLALPLAWFAAEFVTPRLFPWALADTQIAWSGIASLAEVAGTIPLALVLLSAAEICAAAVERFRRGQRAFGLRETVVVAGLVALIVCGQMRARQIAHELSAADRIKVGMIQGNLDPKDKRDVYQLETNLAKYAELSADAQMDGAELVIWPETVVNHWFAENAQTAAGTRFAPFLNLDVPLIFGGLVYRLSDWTKPPKAAGQKLDQFNSVVLVDPKKKVLGMYHKRVLMPFGEYMPFSQWFPSIKEISPNTGEFSVGDRPEPFTVERRQKAGSELDAAPPRPVKVAMLICYEDLVAWMPREAVNLGADLLAAVANDAWYGDTAAPHQHHLLAAWRAIELRRTLLRVTNTGLTAMVTPLGQTVSALPTFVSGAAVADAPLLELRTIYSIAGDIPSWGLTALLFLTALSAGRGGKKQAADSDIGA